MNKIHVLDCTLRDGGYCNQWQFGFENTKKIIAALTEADIDIIECGFLTNKASYVPEETKFNTPEQISALIPRHDREKLFVAMVNYGEFEPEELPQCRENSLDGIRVAFHKKDWMDALEVCRKIKEKGYKVFIQAMLSLNYSDEEFLKLIHKVNEIEPYSFYIVDSFGMMKSKELVRLFYVVEHNLREGIWIGFHAHNNMQLAYSNARMFVEMHTGRNLIVDSSVYGMGRGAGNLNTELFIDFLNENYGTNYKLPPLLSVIDEFLNEFYQKNHWGYSLPNYIAAVHNAHPNYAGFLDEKKTLTVEGMNELFDLMDEDKKHSFDQSYMENLYHRYMTKGQAQEKHREELQLQLRGKEIVLIAPGRSAESEKEKIIDKSDAGNTLAVSINFEYESVRTRYIFLSNQRRYRELPADKRKKCIVTSNIPGENVYLQTDYDKLRNDVEAVSDNAGLMAIRFFSQMGVKKIYLAGFDGYSHNVEDDYADSRLEIMNRFERLEAMNSGMAKVLKLLGKEVELEFLTTPRHVVI